MKWTRDDTWDGLLSLLVILIMLGAAILGLVTTSHSQTPLGEVTNTPNPSNLGRVWVEDENKELIEFTVTNASARAIRIAFPFQPGTQVISNPPCVHVMKSSNPHTFATNFVAEIRAENLVPQVIMQFAESGEICQKYGHKWTPGPFYAVVESYETCAVCRKVEMVQLPHSK